MVPFARYIGIDWSGRQEYGRKNAKSDFPIQLVECQPESRRLVTLAPPILESTKAGRWTRTAVLERLCNAAEGGPTPVLVGLDFAFSFPWMDTRAYFPDHVETPASWADLLVFVRGLVGEDFSPGPFVEREGFSEHFLISGREKTLFRDRYRVTENPAFLCGLRPASVFKLIGPDQVGKGAISGIALLAELRQRLGRRLFVWPFDGTTPSPEARIVLVEVFPRLLYELAGRPPNAAYRYPKVFRSALQELGVAEIDGVLTAHLGFPLGEDLADAMVAAASLAAQAAEEDFWRAPEQLGPAVHSREGWIWGAGVPALPEQRGGMTFCARESVRVSLRRDELFTPDACQSMVDDVHLGEGHQEENLYLGIRHDVTTFFSARGIRWHGNAGCDASVLSSQVACLNFLFPLASRPQSLLPILAALGIQVAEVLPIELEAPLADGSRPYVTFEWIGERNYLNEPGRRTRGKWVTNADALLRYRDTAGQTVLVLVEWKYCEAYPAGCPCRYSRRGTDRLEIYLPLLDQASCQVGVRGRQGLADLFYDPFEQLLRLQLLASAMQREREMAADHVVVWLIAPSANRELVRLVTSPALRARGATLPDVWTDVAAPGHFRFVPTERLLEAVRATGSDPPWVEYLNRRYGGMW